MTIVFTCKDQFDDMMTCVYEAWASRLGHSNVKLKTEPVGNLELFCNYRHVDADIKRAASVTKSIRKKIGDHAYSIIYHAAMSSDPDKLDFIYRFIVAGFHYGAPVLDFLQEPVIMRMFELDRKVANEAHFFNEFTRFSNLPGNILVAHISPKSNVLTLIAHHFEDRMPSENWMIIDDTRNLALVHPKDERYYLTSLTNEEMDHLAQRADDPYVNLWKTFFHTIGIKERENPRCQRNMMPLWYRKNMTEFL